jgi:hypothetical protein
MPADIGDTACPDDLLSSAAAIASQSTTRGLKNVDRLIGRYPSDARLHFLRGSLLAGLQRYDEAREAMHGAITISPGFALARFQLGFLEFTSGDAQTASATWGALKSQPENSPLLAFVCGLEALAEDRFDDAVALLTDGISKNTTLDPLNADMQLIIDAVRRDHPSEGRSEEAVSATHLLLQQYGRNVKPN